MGPPDGRAVPAQSVQYRKPLRPSHDMSSTAPPPATLPPHSLHSWPATRRRALGVLGLLGVASAGPAEHTAARKKNRKRNCPRHQKKIGYLLCFNGETIVTGPCGREKWFERGALPGRCPEPCVPQCADCAGGDDGCGGTCTCPEGQACVDATAQGSG
ncbi:MAG: hypothetical protein M3Z20_14375 [Chloroflexota bacterium]|nr:hypothetical protein [Chloroflexota bacterium]